MKNEIKTFGLDEINELDMAVFIVRRDLVESVKKDIMERGGRILSSIYGTGISRSRMFEALADGTPSCLILVAVRKEDSLNLVGEVSIKNKLNKQGRGKAFKMDIDGYLGAKALFI